jgi:hypothetical protein
MVQLDTPRAPLLLAAITAAISTRIFCIEPPARREIIVVYTWWRVLEALCGQLGMSMVAVKGVQEPRFAALLVGIAALLAHRR